MPEITPDMAGTWLDGCHGWHNNYRVVDCAVEYGFIVPEDYREALETFRHSGGHIMSDDVAEAIYGQGELSDMATDYLNEHAPEGYVFVWDAGEFSLMTHADSEMI